VLGVGRDQPDADAARADHARHGRHHSDLEREAAAAGQGAAVRAGAVVDGVLEELVNQR